MSVLHGRSLRGLAARIAGMALVLLAACELAACNKKEIVPDSHPAPAAPGADGQAGTGMPPAQPVEPPWPIDSPRRSAPETGSAGAAAGAADMEAERQERAEMAERRAASAAKRAPMEKSAGAKKARSSAPVFPWPPPRASDSIVLPAGLLKAGGRMPATLGDVDRILLGALESSGYVSRSYFPVDGGFAIATRLEQIQGDGAPMDGDRRWSEDVAPLDSLSLIAWGRALFLANPGYFRIIVFVVSDKPFAQSDRRPAEQEATGWVSSGWNVLPDEIAARPYRRNVAVTALVYEIEKAPGKAAEVLKQGKLLARVHLQKSGIWQRLGK